MSRSLDFIGKEPEPGPSLAIHPVQQNGDLSPDEPIYLMASLSSTAKMEREEFVLSAKRTNWPWLRRLRLVPFTACLPVPDELTDEMRYSANNDVLATSTGSSDQFTLWTIPRKSKIL